MQLHNVSPLWAANPLVITAPVAELTHLGVPSPPPTVCSILTAYGHCDPALFDTCCPARGYVLVIFVYKLPCTVAPEYVHVAATPFIVVETVLSINIWKR
jgi:hypothetical protein